jgi:tetratricopeptide (TPR) repeat protein
VRSRQRRSLLSLFARAAAAAAFPFVLSGPAAAAEPQPWLKTAEERYARYRRTLDPTDLAASEAAVAKGLTGSPGDFALRKFRLRLLLPHHRFEDLARAAAALKAERPDDAELDGALGDAFLEVGRYPEAFAAYDRFLAKSRSTASYSRVALAKDVAGDLPGALTAMDLAAGAALPDDLEGYAWCRSRAARILLKLNRYEDAEGRLVEALLRVPNHAPALAAAAEIAARKSLWEPATRLAEQSFALVPEFSVAAALVDYRRAMGDREEEARARVTVKTLEALLPEPEKKVHRLLALYLAEHGDAKRAALMTAEELETRQDVAGYDAYAWALYAAGRAKEAVEPMAKALAMGTIDPLFEFHAGAIARAAGDRKEALRHLTRALEIDPRFHVLHAAEARQMMKEIEKGIEEERRRETRKEISSNG